MSVPAARAEMDADNSRMRNLHFANVAPPRTTDGSLQLARTVYGAD